MDNSLDIDLHPPESYPSQSPANNKETSLQILVSIPKPQTKAGWWEHIRVTKIGLFAASLYMFILAISLMKSGARSLAPLISGFSATSAGANCLGFGWMFAYTIMSGSPVAAAALTFLDANVIDKLGAFTMITGSRLGASFIVLFVGFIYVLRGRDRATSLSMGTLSMTITTTTYLPGLLLGMLILNTGILDNVQLQSGAQLISLIDLIVTPITGLATNLFPYWVIFLLGLVVILISFNLFDKCLPQMTLKDSQVGWMSGLVFRPIVMFLLGAAVTMISMSVSISLALLVPLSDRGYIRRENVIPYIMGANITTFIDTLLAAVLLNNPGAFTVVLVGMVSTTVVSFIILITLYRPYQRTTLNFTNWVTASNRNLVIFMTIILFAPLILILI